MKRISALFVVCLIAIHAAGQSDVSAPNVHADNSVSIGTASTSLPFFASKSGVLLSGSAYSVARIEDPSGKGVQLGYDTSGNVGVISSIGSSSSLAFWTNDGTWAERMRIDGSRVGIGMAPGNWALDVNTTGTNGFRVSLAAGLGLELTTHSGLSRTRILSYNRTQNTYGDLFIETGPNEDGTLFKNNGSVGFGAANPDARATFQAATGKIVSFKDANGVTRAFLYGQHGSSYYYDLNSTNYDLRLTSYFQGGTGGNVTFWTGTTSTPVERMRVSTDGRVGIGTPSPAKLLHVAGDIQVDGNINAKYQDIAEWVPAIETLEPGMVVIIAPMNHVAASSDAYDTRVAGVVSPRPGLTLGEPGESKVLVATTGRVKVRVDASAGPIREGDILVSSGIKGTAMKSEPLMLDGRKFHQPGTVIGKALEPLPSGTGEILVLLSLQ